MLRRCGIGAASLLMSLCMLSHFLSVYEDVLEMEVADCVGVIVIDNYVGLEMGGVAIEMDVLEPDVAHVVAWSPVILLREVYAKVEEGGGDDVLDADVAEVDVLDTVLVAAANSHDAVTVG